jgi:hypothetical protein
MRWTNGLALGGLAAVLLTAGCQKLNFEKTQALGPGDVRSFEIDAPKRDQTVSIEVSSSAAPITVCVATEDRSSAVEQALVSGKKPEGTLAHKEKVQNETIEVTAPAKKKFVVFLAEASKETQVSVKIKGK